MATTTHREPLTERNFLTKHWEMTQELALFLAFPASYRTDYPYAQHGSYILLVFLCGLWWPLGGGPSRMGFLTFRPLVVLPGIIAWLLIRRQPCTR